MNRFKETEKMPGEKKMAGCRKHRKAGTGSIDAYFSSTQEVEGRGQQESESKSQLRQISETPNREGVIP